MTTGYQEDEYCDYEQIDAPASQPECQYSEDNNSASPFLGLLSSAKDLYLQCKQMEKRAEILKTWSQIRITETVAKYKSCQEFLYYTFGERDKALCKHYELLDKAIADSNNDMVIAALKGISGIVVKSPLEDFSQFVRLYEDTSQPLLDF